MRALGS
ncbi:hypothetical protein E2C01_098137 [Portunus trituberculatus]|nr:hypothetical protein [Portunus trituberculatus]